jgi:hypothetical protein
VQDSVCRMIWVWVLGEVDFHFCRRVMAGKSLPIPPQSPMPFAKQSPEEFDRVAREVLKALHHADAHPIPQTKGLTFADIERTAHAVGQRLAAQITAEALANAAQEQAEFAACPKCQNSTRVTRKNREVRTLDGPIDYLEPAAHCVACRRDFFPSASATAPQ